MSILDWLQRAEPLIWALHQAPEDATDTQLADIVRKHWPR